MKKIFCKFLSIVLALGGVLQVAPIPQAHALKLSYILKDTTPTPNCLRTLEILSDMLKAEDAVLDTEDLERVWGKEQVINALEIIFLKIMNTHSMITSEDMSFSGLGPNAHITIKNYIIRFLNYTYVEVPKPVVSKVSMSTIIMTLILLDMMQSKSDGKIVMEQRNIHRLFASAYLVSLKFCEDSYPSNLYMARVAGIPVGEMNQLEAAFLTKSRFDVAPREEEFQKYHRLFENLLRKMHNIT